MEKRMDMPVEEIPVYRQSADYAREHGELDAYRLSHSLNIDCAQAIEAAIFRHYSNNKLHPGGAEQVAEEYGMERTLYVLANTVCFAPWDMRYTKQNKRWANEQGIVQDRLGRNTDFLIGNTNAGLVNLFVDEARELEQKMQEMDVPEAVKSR